MAKKKANPLFEIFLPQEGDEAAIKIRKIAILVGCVAVLTAMIVLLIVLLTQQPSKPVDNPNDITTPPQSTTVSTEPVEVTTEPVREPQIKEEYLPYYNENSDMVGWIKLDDTPIDYYVVQGKDNKEYLHADFNKNYSFAGTIFADAREKITATHRPDNIVLYGHNMNNGSMFAKLTSYYPYKMGNIDFYKKHPTIQFNTLWEDGTYKIFAAMYINTQSKHDNGNPVFEYYKVSNFENEEAFLEYIIQVMDRSQFYTDVDLQYGDEILTLSTCVYTLGESIDSRFVVFARRVREGESPEVNTELAYINSSPLYFAKYYSVMGGSWAGRKWDLSLVKGAEEYLKDHTVNGQ